jgi:hypothetical protein
MLPALCILCGVLLTKGEGQGKCELLVLLPSGLKTKQDLIALSLLLICKMRIWKPYFKLSSLIKIVFVKQRRQVPVRYQCSWEISKLGVRLLRDTSFLLDSSPPKFCEMISFIFVSKYLLFCFGIIIYSIFLFWKDGIFRAFELLLFLLIRFLEYNHACSITYCPGLQYKATWAYSEATVQSSPLSARDKFQDPSGILKPQLYQTLFKLFFFFLKHMYLFWNRHIKRLTIMTSNEIDHL